MSKTVTLKVLDQLMNAAVEDEHLEFKAATINFPMNDVVEYVAAIANKKGGYLLLGVTDEVPRRVSNCQSFPTPHNLNQLKNEIKNRTNLNVPIFELQHPDGRVLVLEIPSRPTGGLIRTGRKGRILTRSGESLVDMDDEEMRTILNETASDWLTDFATDYVPALKILELLEFETLFRLLNQPVPESPEAICTRLVSLRLLDEYKGTFAITNLGALVAARSLTAISPEFASTLPRLIVYKGTNNRNYKSDVEFDRGYAVGFEDLVQGSYLAASPSDPEEQILRTQFNPYPIQSFRELIANALVHQDFSVKGAQVMIEIYDDRVEFSNPGAPLIETDRFIDGALSRNDVLVRLMRLLRVCEERGSGVDKVVSSAEGGNLPAPDFRSDEVRTKVILFGQRSFAEMSQEDRVRACYQHCCLLYLDSKTLSNQSLRTRFALSANDRATVTTIISEAVAAELIKPAPNSGSSTRFARYIPYWA